MAKTSKKTFGSWAFLIGFVLALVFGVIGVTQVIAWVLVVLGLVVGFLNIADDETQQFLMSGAVLVIVSYMGSQAMSIIPLLANVLIAMMLLFIPATVIVAIKSVFALAKN
ncbi:MAG: hypothetical protein KJ583_07625 [Nanoarchaeota archaeon]|nr:hypothetical protein [Nanoarchaeota archaeon]MBU1269848.1 hypothetical protein [Nanoarchaeota archaeon]MBU1605157.1 hypothetical protein [Nanoarchaeota archaeon]MBU2442971.1 hypothetical protein [Nanoarchaeota archaeon]